MMFLSIRRDFVKKLPLSLLELEKGSKKLSWSSSLDHQNKSTWSQTSEAWPNQATVTHETRL